jgi:hypothetical protein
MDAIKGIFRGGRLELETAPDWPDGTVVLIEPAPVRAGKIGIAEAEWRDDAEALADWESWIITIEPLEFTPEEESGIAEFDAKMRRYNVEAV